MKIIKDIDQIPQEVQACISVYGHLAQHNYYLYLNYNRKDEKHIFFDAGNNRGVMAYQKKDNWHILTDPIAPFAEKKKILLEVIGWIFKNSRAKKIILEDITEGLKKEIGVAAKQNTWRAVKPSYSLIWPVIDLENWTGQGGHYKRIRNAWHKFFRDNKIEFKDAKKINAKDLNRLILKWKAQRQDNDRVHLSPYLKFAANNFQDFDVVRLMVVQGKPISVAAGWAIPNSDGFYYSCVGIYDYDYKNIGEAAYWDEMIKLKELDYKKIDLGGSLGGLLAFKNKFYPASSYTTYTFSILRK
ncbi:MAG: hypothetical protein LiPW39_171 [Parcubacteria group bacterium LiPW_39]|nr:MAG: hypothetical protein LiPW39_171 [Parcubacteria group bacterium LiPW_39]